MFPSGPPLYRSFTSIQMEHTHTHTLPQQGKSNENEHEMKMTMKWQLPNRDPGRGTQKKRTEKRREHQHDTPSPERANPGKAREQKSGRTTGQKPTRGGGGGRKRLTQPTRREPRLPRHAKDPNLPNTGARNTWKKGTHGDLVNEQGTSRLACKFRDKAQVGELGAQLNLTEKPKWPYLRKRTCLMPDHVLQTSWVSL